MYLDLDDLPMLEQFLNDDEQILFVVRTGESLFQTFKPFKLRPNMECTLWHLPCGKIPLACRDAKGRITVDPCIPTASQLGAISLELQVRPRKYQTLVPRACGQLYDLCNFDDDSAIGRSDFGWIGNRFSSCSERPNKKTELWWNRLRRWISKNAIKIPFYGPIDGPRRDAWAFPAAYSAIKSGTPRSANSFFLKDLLQSLVVKVE